MDIWKCSYVHFFCDHLGLHPCQLSDAFNTNGLFLHLSGYTGHIPARTTAASSLTVRDPNAKGLIMENYTPYLGYTGRLGR